MGNSYQSYYRTFHPGKYLIYNSKFCSPNNLPTLVYKKDMGIGSSFCQNTIEQFAKFTLALLYKFFQNMLSGYVT